MPIEPLIAVLIEAACAKRLFSAAVSAEVSAAGKFAFGSVISPVSGSIVMPAR